MFKYSAKIVIIILIVLFSTKTTLAYFGFGGKIINNKATEIQILENAGFTCIVPGQSITIKPVGAYPTTYLIPSWIISSTKTSIRISQNILGVYNPVKTPIYCFKSCPAPIFICPAVTFLSPVLLYGTSK